MSDLKNRPKPGIAAGQRKPFSAKRRLLRALTLSSIACLVWGSYFRGAQIMRFIQNKGLVVIDVDDPSLVVTVEENKVVVQNRPDDREITLPTGPHQLEVIIKSRQGRVVGILGETFTLGRGEKKVFDVYRQMANSRMPATADVIVPGTANSGPPKKEAAPKEAPKGSSH